MRDIASRARFLLTSDARHDSCCAVVSRQHPAMAAVFSSAFHSPWDSGAPVQKQLSSGYSPAMCGRFTQHYTWRELVALYRLTQPAGNLQPRYNIAPTTTIDVMIPRGGPSYFGGAIAGCIVLVSVMAPLLTQPAA
jgi:hypothetical protein